MESTRNINLVVHCEKNLYMAEKFTWRTLTLGSVHLYLKAYLIEFKRMNT